MIVLDYLKDTVDGKLVVPPFHTGHLGLMPQTEVQVSLMTPYVDPPTHCEVVITPFPQSAGNMMQLNCIMRDRPGVVSRLIDAVWDLHINIVTLESSAINYLSHHFVNMILDWTTSTVRPGTMSNPSVRHRYQDYRSILPVTELRSVELFESIMAHCGDVLIWEEVGGTKLPKLMLRPQSAGHGRYSSSMTVQTHHGGRPYEISIELPRNIINGLTSQLQTNKDALAYIILSETEERILRAFFPNPDIIERLIHVGFYHDDSPGVLSLLLGLIARGGEFNILTSILRKQTIQRSICEMLLEYRGQGTMPRPENIIHWTAGKLMEKVKASEVARLKKYNIEVGLPRYPKRKEASASLIKLNTMITQSPGEKEPGKQRAELLDERVNDLKAEGMMDSDPEIRLLKLIAERVQKSVPSIFLSYPVNASEHARLLKDRLGKTYHVIEYQVPDGEIIVGRVIDMVTSCDLFLGIWHYEGLQPGGKTYGISPWLPFEYGVALAAGKPTFIVRSEKLDDRIWKRIRPEIAMPEYSDVRFERDTIVVIEDYCKRHFIEPQ